jgi:glycosyltransferase involved in cell wall biosynthesis
LGRAGANARGMPLKKIKKVLRLIQRLKLRHLNLGIKGFTKLASYQLMQIFIPKKLTDQSLNLSSWIVRRPSISIFLTVFNQSVAELETAINSARIQTGAEITIVILDDGSTNQVTIEFLDNFIPYSNEVVIRQENTGVVKARNRLINEAHTDFLVFLDPDDEFEPNYILEAAKVLEADRSVEILFPDVSIHDEIQDTISDRKTGPFDINFLKQVNTIPMSSIISSRLIKDLGGFSLDFVNGPEDWDLWVRAALSNANARHLPIVGYKYTKARISRSSQVLNLSDIINLRKYGVKAGFPYEAKKSIEIFLLIPWLPRIGGVEKYVKCLMADLNSAGFKVALLITESDPIGYEDDSLNFRAQGNIVLKRGDFASNELFLEAIQNLATNNCLAINFGSPWDFENYKLTQNIYSKRVCFIFNTGVSLRRALDNREQFDEFWLAYNGIMKKMPGNLNPRAYTIYTGVVDKNIEVEADKSDRAFTVGFLGRFSPEKNPELFLDIAKQMEALTDFKFVMGGEGQLLEKIMEKSAKLSNLEYLGFISDSASFFSQIDYLMITSEIEGIPLTAMEALNHGVPVISRPVGGMSELLVTEGQGRIWPGDVIEAKELLITLRNHKKSESAQSLLPEKFLRKNAIGVVIERIKQLGME